MDQLAGSGSLGVAFAMFVTIWAILLFFVPFMVYSISRKLGDILKILEKLAMQNTTSEKKWPRVE